MLMHFKQSHLISISLCLKIQAAFVSALVWAVGNLLWSTEAAEINASVTSIKVLALAVVEFWFLHHKMHRGICRMQLKLLPSIICCRVRAYLIFLDRLQKNAVNCTLLRFVCVMRQWKYSRLTISRSSLLHFCRNLMRYVMWLWLKTEFN